MPMMAAQSFVSMESVTSDALNILDLAVQPQTFG
jgi:hypothetical protein